MATPSKVVSDESGGEMGRSGDHDPIPRPPPPPPGFIADSLSQAPQSSHGVAGRDVEVGGRFASGCQAPSPALRVGLALSNSASAPSGVLPGGHGMGVDGRGLGGGGRVLGGDATWQARPDAVGCGLGFGANWQARPEAATDGVGLAGVVGRGMGGNGAGDSLRS
jgi:hypothetical protein